MTTCAPATFSLKPTIQLGVSRALSNHISSEFVDPGTTSEAYSGTHKLLCFLGKQSLVAPKIPKKQTVFNPECKRHHEEYPNFNKNACTHIYVSTKRGQAYPEQ